MTAHKLLAPLLPQAQITTIKPTNYFIESVGWAVPITLPIKPIYPNKKANKMKRLSLILLLTACQIVMASDEQGSGSGPTISGNEQGSGSSPYTTAGNEQGSGGMPNSTTSNEDIQYIQACTQTTCTIFAVGTGNNG